MPAPYVIRDKLMGRFYCGPKPREAHGSWQYDPEQAHRFDTRDAADTKAENLKRCHNRANRWRFEILPLSEAAPLASFNFGESPV